MKKSIIFCACTCIFWACSSEQDDDFTDRTMFQSQRASYAIMNNDNSITEVDSTTFFREVAPASKYTPQELFRNMPIAKSSITTMRATGFTNKSVVIKQTLCSYSSDNSIILSVGLPSGLYFTECIMVTKSLSSYEVGDFIVPVPAVEGQKDMGLINAGLYATNLGWTPDESIENGDKTFNGITYLIHFTYTGGGQAIDKYYPCRPEELVWNYYSIQNSTSK